MTGVPAGAESSFTGNMSGGGGSDRGFDLGGLVQDIGFSSFTNLQNKKAASKARKWDWSVARHAYRTAAVDLEKAGLNRILALGSPTNTPSAPVAKVDRPNRETIGLAAASARQAIEQSKALTKAANTQAAVNAQTEKNLKQDGRVKENVADVSDVVSSPAQMVHPIVEELTNQVQKGASNSRDAINLPGLRMKFLDWLLKDRDEQVDKLHERK